MQNRLFQMPRDLYDALVLNQLPSLYDRKAALVGRSGSLQEAQDRFAVYLARALSTSAGIWNFIAGIERRDIAWFLQNHFVVGSPAFQRLEECAQAETGTVLDYACYALVADVTKLDREKLERTIDELNGCGAVPRLIASLEIIADYLDHGSDALNDSLGAHPHAAYVNLRGAEITGQLGPHQEGVVIDLSYADLRETTFSPDCGPYVTLEGANCAYAVFDHRTNVCVANTTGIILNHVNNNGYILEFEDGEDLRHNPFVVHLFPQMLQVNDRDNKCTIL